MAWLGALIAVAMILVVLVDAFEVVLLPRRIRHGFRLARIFFRTSWLVGRTAARFLPIGRWRTAFLSTFGPLCLFALVVVWAGGSFSASPCCIGRWARRYRRAAPASVITFTSAARHFSRSVTAIWLPRVEPVEC